MSLLADGQGSWQESAEEAGEEITLPSGSPLQFEEHDSGMAILVPAQGLIRGSRGLFVMALFWLFLTVPGSLVVLVSVIAEMQGSEETSGWEDLIMVGLFSLVFVGAGVGMLLLSISLGYRSYQIVLSNDGLSVQTNGWRRQRVDHLALDQIEAIVMGHSGMTVNNKRIMEVQAFSPGKQRKALGMLTTCSDAEVAWAAARLEHTRRRLGGSPPPEEPELTEDSLSSPIDRPSA